MIFSNVSLGLEVFRINLLLHSLFAKDRGVDWTVRATRIKGGWSISLRTTRDNIPIGTTYADINILGDVFYLLHIEIQQGHRGKGHGTELYRLFEQVAKELGCKRIEQTPSGTTIRGETRAAYLKRRGWQTNETIAWKDL